MYVCMNGSWIEKENASLRCCDEIGYDAEIMSLSVILCMWPLSRAGQVVIRRQFDQWFHIYKCLLNNL